MNAAVLLIGIQDQGKLLAVAEVDDPKLLRSAADHALAQAQKSVQDAKRHSPRVARLREAELERLRVVLVDLIPDLALDPAPVLQ